MRIVFALLLILSFTSFVQADDARKQKIAQLRENVCADPNAQDKAKTEAVGLCLNCLESGSKDPIAKMKIDTSNLEVQEREKKFFRLMEENGRLDRNESNEICKTLSACAELQKKYQNHIEIMKKKYETQQKKFDAAYDELQIFIKSDLTKTPLPKQTSNSPYIGHIFMQLSAVLEDNPSLKEKLDKFHEEWMNDSEGVVLDLEAGQAFAAQAKKMQKKQSVFSTKVVESKIKKVEQQIEVLKKPKTAKKMTEDDEINELRKLAEKEIQNVSENKGFRRCDLSTAELFAIYDYSGEGYLGVNRALREGAESAERYESYKQVLSSALKKLRKHGDFVDRGASLPMEVLEQYQVGAIVESPAFTSTSVFEGFGGEQRFTIKTKTGAYIAPFSANENEEEVLIPAGVKFKVLERQGDPNMGKMKFVLEEVDP